MDSNDKSTILPLILGKIGRTIWVQCSEHPFLRTIQSQCRNVRNSFCVGRQCHFWAHCLLNRYGHCCVCECRPLYCPNCVPLEWFSRLCQKVRSSRPAMHRKVPHSVGDPEKLNKKNSWVKTINCLRCVGSPEVEGILQLQIVTLINLRMFGTKNGTQSVLGCAHSHATNQRWSFAGQQEKVVENKEDSVNVSKWGCWAK